MDVRKLLNTAFMDSIITDRTILRNQGKYKEADRIRDRLNNIGIKLIDTPEGTDWKFKEAKS